MYLAYGSTATEFYGIPFLTNKNDQSQCNGNKYFQGLYTINNCMFERCVRVTVTKDMTDSKKDPVVAC